MKTIGMLDFLRGSRCTIAKILSVVTPPRESTHVGCLDDRSFSRSGSEKGMPSSIEIRSGLFAGVDQLLRYLQSTDRRR